MKRILVALGATVLVAVLIWFGLGIVAPDIYVEQAFVYIFYPSIITGIIAGAAWRTRKQAS